MVKKYQKIAHHLESQLFYQPDIPQPQSAQNNQEIENIEVDEFDFNMLQADEIDFQRPRAQVLQTVYPDIEEDPQNQVIKTQVNK